MAVVTEKALAHVFEQDRLTLPSFDHDTISSNPELGVARYWSGGKNGETEAILSLQLGLDETHVISSPYPDLANQLDLQDLDVPNRLLAIALTSLKPTRDDYATAPYLETFNWTEVFSHLRELCRHAKYQWEELNFYVVIFRSKLLPGIDRERLGLLDKMSHSEACESGGLLKYWFGSCDSERQNLATCLWRNSGDAVRGGAGPWHKKARAAARTMYERIDFHTHRLVIERGAGSWRLEKVA